MKFRTRGTGTTQRRTITSDTRLHDGVRRTNLPIPYGVRAPTDLWAIMGRVSAQATRHIVTDSDIESFMRAFEDGSLAKSEWTHSRHLVMALWYLRLHKRDEATRLIRDGIRRHNERQGNLTGYHETITLAWVAVIERFLGARP